MPITNYKIVDSVPPPTPRSNWNTGFSAQLREVAANGEKIAIPHLSDRKMGSARALAYLVGSEMGLQGRTRTVRDGDNTTLYIWFEANED